MPDLQVRALLALAEQRLALSIDAVTDEDGVVWVERVGGRPVSMENRAAVRLYFFLRSCGLGVGSEAGVLFGPPRSRFNPTPADYADGIRIAPPP